MSDDSESVRDEARKVLADEFGDAEFPVSSQMDLVPALSSGPTTKFEFGDKSMTAMDMATMGGSDMDFPYDDLDAFLDDALDLLDENEYFD